MTQVMNTIMASGEYPQEWKEASLMLLTKRPPTETAPPSYRPICLLNSMSKLLEHLLAGRLRAELEERAPLADNQYGFRRGKSTVDAIRRVVELSEKANQGTRRTRQFCVLITLDVRNAFNAVAWEFLIEELNARGISPYLLRMIKSYLSNRWLLLTDRDGGQRKIRVTSGVPLGSMCSRMF